MGCHRVGLFALFSRTSSEEDKSHLGIGDLEHQPAREVEPISRRSISQPSPFGALIGRLTIHSGKGVLGKPQKTLFVSASQRAPVIALFPRGPVGSIFFHPPSPQLIEDNRCRDEYEF